MLLEKAFDGYWLEKRRDFSPHTVREYQLTFRRLQAFLGPDAHTESVTTDQVRAFLNHLQEQYELSEKTLSNCWAALSSFWTWASPELGLPHLIRDRIKRPRYHRPTIETYTQEHVQAMLNACSQTKTYSTRLGRKASNTRPTALRDKAIILTLVDTGLRASELCNLTMADYNDKTGQLNIRQGKGKKDRIVYISESARKAMWKYQAERKPKPGAPLFPTRTGDHLGRDELLNMIEATAKRAGLTIKANCHRFRHTFALNFLRNGGNILALQDLLGHERLETIRIYARLAQVDLKAAQTQASVADHWRLK